MDDELVQLETVYNEPGVLLLASDASGEPLGCVGLQSLGDHGGVLVGEIRRLFVRDTGRGQGLGRRLMAELTEHATEAGFGRLVLNTMPAMREAVGLYESLGYGHIDPYVSNPEDHTLYMGIALA